MALVTGMAWATPLGDCLDSVWEMMLRGNTGIAPVPHQARLRNNLAAQVQNPDPALAPAERLHRLACRTAQAALDSANRRSDEPNTVLVLGTSLGTYLENGPKDSLYAWAQSVGRELGFISPPIAISTACSSSSDAILLGLTLIRAGQVRCCVCGGADVLTWSKRAGHSALGTLSPTHLRAFDVQHDGTLLGEGAGFLVLEADTAGGGKNALAVLRGAGSANDATGMTAADVTGRAARYAIDRSLADAKLPADAIGLINAHGSGTPMNDMTEKNALGTIFTAKPAPLVFATKGNFGHSLGATGALEAISLVMAMRTGRVPPIAGLENPDPEFPLPLAHPAAVSHRAQFGLSLTLGFGGFDTSLVFEALQ